MSHDVLAKKMAVFRFLLLLNPPLILKRRIKGECVLLFILVCLNCLSALQTPIKLIGKAKGKAPASASTGITPKLER